MSPVWKKSAPNHHRAMLLVAREPTVPGRIARTLLPDLERLRGLYYREVVLKDRVTAAGLCRSVAFRCNRILRPYRLRISEIRVDPERHHHVLVSHGDLHLAEITTTGFNLYLPSVRAAARAKEQT